MYSLIVPVYKNEGSIPDLIKAVEEIQQALDDQFEAIFVVDGSPDRSNSILSEKLPTANFKSKLILLSRNFGSTSAVRVGLRRANGQYFAVMAADLQEPPELAVKFFKSLRSNLSDVVIGTRKRRDDPFLSRFFSDLFWFLYRKFVVPEMPRGGIDVFACNRRFRDQLLQLDEAHSSYIALIFWLGFRRNQVSYDRGKRIHGKSAWTFRKKTKYLMDSVFAFTDLPIRILIYVGIGGLALSSALGVLTFVARIRGWILLPGYAATILMILFFGALNLFGIGLIGSYAWRTYENTKRRPLAVVMLETAFDGQQ